MKGLGIAVLIGGAIYLWSRRGAKPAVAAAASALTSPIAPKSIAEAATQAAKVESQLGAVAAVYPEDPTLASHLAQAVASARLTLESGFSLSEDPGARTFASQLQEYEAYKAAGGVKDFSGFSVYSLDPEGTKWYNWRLSGEFVAVPIGRTGGERITDPLQSPFAMTSYPAVNGEVVPYVPPEEVVAAVKESAVPSGFTATKSQLDSIKPVISETEYKTVIDLAYVKAAAECTEDKVVSWTSSGGYEAKTYSQLSSGDSGTSSSSIISRPW